MIAQAEVTCDKDHIYRKGGVIKPGFSEILSSVGFSKNPYWTDAGREEGRALHEWLLFLAQGQESETKPDARIAGRVEGIRKFLRENDFAFIGGETPLYCQMGYCCTPDLWGYLDGAPVVIEAKRGGKMKRHLLQTAAQVLALNDNGFAPAFRYGLYLTDGDFLLEAHDDEEDFESWKAILAGYFAKEQYK